MTHSTRAKRTTLSAAIVFGLVYLGALAFIFAPKGTFSSHNSVLQTSVLP